MEPGYVSLEIIETVSAGPSGGIKIDAVKSFHDINVIRDLIIRNNGIAESFDLDILTVIFSYRDTVIDDLGNDHHAFADLFFQSSFALFQCFELFGDGCNLFLYFLSFLSLSLSHESADLLAYLVALASEFVAARAGISELPVEVKDLIDQNQLLVLEFLSYVLLNKFGVCTQ